MNNNTTDILNIKISRSNLKETLLILSNAICENSKIRVCVLPVNCIVRSIKNRKLKEMYNSSHMNLADGVPVIWASKFLGAPIRGRVTGMDLLPDFSKVAADKGYSFFFLGAKEGVAKHLAEVLKRENPALNVVGCYSPPFADRFLPQENEKIIQMINNVSPNVLWVSLTAPKQDIWIYENFERLQVNVAIGVGGAFEVTAGLIKRAPLWMQRHGLEWFYRFVQEPTRLYKRYFIEAPQFIPLVILQKFGLSKK